MAQQSIFGPFFATMFLTLIVWVYMYARRIHFLHSKKINPNDLAAPGTLARLSPAAISNPSDNLKNLFEMPVLFNLVLLRFWLYAISTIALTFMAIRAGLAYFGVL